jgi:two-component system, sensor histidine kinase
MVKAQARRAPALLDEYCSQLGTVLDRRSPGLALVTARQQAFHRMLRAEESASAKAKFLAHMSHELRTPVHGVMGMLELVSRTEPGPQQQRYIHTARRSAEALLGIINGILEISKIEAGKMELEQTAFDLKHVVQEVTETFAEMSSGKGLQLACTIPANLPKALVGDAGRLRQILTNLIGNAVKFTEKGEVRVSVQAIEVDDASAFISFEISDTGIGIPPDKQHHVFDAFAQADGSTTRRYGGTGLGLSIAKQLCEMMGGTIDVASEPGRGSTFRFTARLERQQEAASQPVVSPLRSDPEPEGIVGTRVLLVEDNPVNLEVALALLESSGCEVETATNGLEALESHARGEYGMIFMDCQMPEMDGFEAAAEIRRRESGSGRRVPIVALTASAIEGDREQCLAAGMDDYLPKPFTAAQIRSTLALWLNPAQTSAAAVARVASGVGAGLRTRPKNRHRPESPRR